MKTPLLLKRALLCATVLGLMAFVPLAASAAPPLDPTTVRIHALGMGEGFTRTATLTHTINVTPRGAQGLGIHCADDHGMPAPHVMAGLVVGEVLAT